MLRQVRIVGLCFVLVGLLLKPAEAVAQDKPAYAKVNSVNIEPIPALCFAPGTPQEVIDAAYKALANRRGAGADLELFQFNDGNRWSATASNPGPLGQGDPTVLTWSYIPDGTFIPGGGEPSGNSNLTAWLNGLYGGFATWHPLFVQVFERWGELTGVTYIYEPNDDGAAFPSAGGVVGVRGDVRIAAHFIDGDFNILAYNYFPDTGDMVLDSADSFYNDTSGNSLRFRNVVAHEHGHGLGISHVCPLNQTKLMEPLLTVGFDGPQHDDILAANRGYGDPFEHNDTSGTATDLGAVASGGSVTIADVSVDDNSDENWYGVTLPADAQITVTVTPVGSTYLSGAQNPDGSCSAGTPFDSLSQNDLGLEVLAPDGTTILASANINPAGSPEVIADLDLLDGAGTYFLGVFGGTANAAQLYELDMNLETDCPACPGCVVEYEEDFSTDPGWTTDQAGNYFWDSATQTYHATTSNAEPCYRPSRYAYKLVNYDGNSLKLEFDMLPSDLQWSAAVQFGLFDDDLAATATLAPDANYLWVAMGRVDGGRHLNLGVRGVTGVSQGAAFAYNSFNEGTWYHCIVEYATDTDEASLTVTERDTGTPVGVGTITLTNVGGLPADLDYLGFARDSAGDCCCDPGSCSGYSCVNAATAYLDNIVFCEESVAPLCDDFEDGVIDDTLWEWGGTKRGIGCGGSWQWSHQEAGGFLEMRVWGPTSGGSYGSEAWVRTTYDYNDGSNYIINFTWEIDTNAWHVDDYAIHITDGTIPGGCNIHWLSGDDEAGWVTLYFTESDPGDMLPTEWSICVDAASDTATVFDGPDCTGSVMGQGTLPPDEPWYVRFILADGTSSGFPAGDNLLNLYDFCSTADGPGCPPGPLSGWEPRASMALPRDHITSAVVAGKVYVFGGHNASVPGTAPNNTTEAYDPPTDTWTSLANMPTGRGMAAAAAVNGIIYVIGGNNCFSNCWRTENEAYNPATDTWETPRASMPTRRGLLTATAVEGLIYAMGGGDSYVHPSALDIVEIYDPASDTWTVGANMPRRRGHHGAVALNGKIYLIGGWSDDGGQHLVPETDIFDTVTGLWTPGGAPIPTARMLLHVSALNGTSMPSAVVWWTEHRFQSWKNTIQCWISGCRCRRSLRPGAGGQRRLLLGASML